MHLTPALLRLDRRAATPLHAQLATKLAALLDAGALDPGHRLPATRTLAAALGVHRTTVVRAYNTLRALGYLVARPGSGARVRARPEPHGPVGTRPGRATLPARLRAARLLRPGHRTQAPPTLFDLAAHLPDPAMRPLRLLWASVRAATLRNGAADLAEYGDPRGAATLRAAVARRLARHGVFVAPDEILVTDGAQHAFDLILREFLPRRGAIAVESPTYPRLLALARDHGATVVPVPMREDGADLDALRRAVHRSAVALFYTMPTFQNPTGCSTTAEHREGVLACCAAAGVGVIEDGFDDELQYAGPAALPIRALDRSGAVLHVGTLSKLAFPGLRVAWIAASRPAVDRLAALRERTSLGGNVLTQAVATHLLERPEFDVYLRRLHRALRARRTAIMQGLSRHLPAWVDHAPPAGGYTLWLSWAAARAREQDVVRRATELGVGVTSGAAYFVARSRRAHLRLSIATLPVDRIEPACERLGLAFRLAARGAPRRAVLA